MNSVEHDEDEKIVEINEYFSCSKIGLASFDDVDDCCWYGGDKYLQANLYCGAYKNLNLDEFIKHIKSIDWKLGSLVQLILCEEHDELFRSIVVVGDRG
jgi:hypothetical protein